MRTLVIITALGALACKGGLEKAKRAVEDRARDEAADRADAVELAARPVVRPTGPGLADGRYRLVEIRVEAEPTKLRKKPWDPPPITAPDLKVRVRVDGREVAACKMTDDALAGRCRFDTEIVIDRATAVTFDVIDRDDLFDDTIGSATLDGPGTWGVAIELPMVVHDRVRAASFVLAATPTWWDLHRARLAGLGLGVLGALGIVGAFRSRLLAPDPIPKIPRCAFCNRKMAEHAIKCGHCGATQ